MLPEHRLLDPNLFTDEHDMLENRHRLNAVVIRRTKADACAPDGARLFARRMVHTEGFTLADEERTFYEALLEYLREGYDLAAKQGKKGRALGFLMTVFQKIAASSFSAVKATLRKRLLALTVLEAVERDELLDVDGRDQALAEARAMVREMHGLPDDAFGKAQADQLVAEIKVAVLKKRRDAAGFTETEQTMDEGEAASAAGDDQAVYMVNVGLPSERARIKELIARFPVGVETKIARLLRALGALWRLNPDEKVVIFTTYLGSIDALKDAVEAHFPDKGVEVLKGGDHGAKIAAQRRFRKPSGPKVLLCTAAGREGINLQFARVLFNHDLPWNPMDLEQRIGRIHRYGQKDTAQVYNLTAADTIEGKIFLLLEEKLQDIAEALGKLDEHGQVAEDLRGQVLGQLNSLLSYDRLYQEAITDPNLVRTKQELEVALGNAELAREVVFDLFQDLDKFNLGDYRRYDDGGGGMRRLVAFVERAAKLEAAEFQRDRTDNYLLYRAGFPPVRLTTDREKALQDKDLQLLGLESPVVKQWLSDLAEIPPEHRCLSAILDETDGDGGLVTVWHVMIQGTGGRVEQRVVRLGLTMNGDRAPHLERPPQRRFTLKPAAPEGGWPAPARLADLLSVHAPRLLHRELTFTGAVTDDTSYSSRLLACIAVMNGGDGVAGPPSS